MALVELEHLSLVFSVSKYGPVRIRDRIAERFVSPGRSPIMRIDALKDINLRLEDGDRVGIIGRNGAGKSTLLKVLADIYPITKGHRRVDGHISALLDIFLGFEPDATGWENIMYRGYLQGETRRSMRRKIKGIAEFCELGQYLNVPVRYYSDGMKVKLGFAVATAIEPDILLVDEAVNAGDLYFREKATNRVRDVMSKASIVVAVSHDHSLLSELCTRLIWLESGSIRAIGPSSEVVAAYEADVHCGRAA